MQLADFNNIPFQNFDVNLNGSFTVGLTAYNYDFYI